MELYAITYADTLKRTQHQPRINYIYAENEDHAKRIATKKLMQMNEAVTLVLKIDFPIHVLIKDNEKKLPYFSIAKKEYDLNLMLLKHPEVYYVNSHRDMSVSTSKIYHQNHFPFDDKNKLRLYHIVYYGNDYNCDKKHYYMISNHVYDSNVVYNRTIDGYSCKCKVLLMKAITNFSCIMERPNHSVKVIRMHALTDHLVNRIAKEYKELPEGTHLFLYNKKEDECYILEIEQKEDNENE